MSSFSPQNVHRNPVLLTGSSTWDVGYALIKITATVQGMWQFVNPDTPSAELPALPEPITPVLPETVDDAKNPINLNRLRYLVYQATMEQYEAVLLFMLRVEESLSTKFLSRTLCSMSAHAMLVVLN
jgi:hypothetical protein